MMTLPYYQSYLSLVPADAVIRTGRTLDGFNWFKGSAGGLGYLIYYGR